MVLPDGRVLNALNKLKKDNTGYDLKDLFIGAEGTLGVITAAVLRLVPRPRSVETAFVGVPSPQAALDLFGLANERATGNVTSFELMLRLGIEMVLRHGAGCRDPLPQPHPWYVLIELSSPARSGLRAVLEDILADGLERGLVEDATIAQVHAAMQAKRLTCRQLVDACLDRIARYDKPNINAIVDPSFLQRM